MVPPRRVGAGSLPRSHARIWRTVASIPPGTVASYGQVAREAGLARCARLVGQVLRRLPPGLDLPWHRVVSATGRISLPGEAGRTQAVLLLEEGIRLVRGRVDMRVYRWAPRRGQRVRAVQGAHRRS
jgi:methylated-DNA-protein-cysteine methyltransferase-like protein